MPDIQDNSPDLWRIPPLTPDANKYSRGHVLLFGGAEMTGAARLAAAAAQRAGAGLVSIAAPARAWPIYAASMLSVIARRCTGPQWAALVADKWIDPVLIGPGAGTQARTRQAIISAAKAGKKLVLDADALTLMATDAALLRALKDCPLIITPHEGEYNRLAKALTLDTNVDKPTRAIALARALGAVVVLKGADTIVADHSGHATHTHPPAWLATGGTGDVLAGIIAALVGQGMASWDAANAGVWLHAEAARGFGPGMIAEDIIAALPQVLRDLHKTVT